MNDKDIEFYSIGVVPPPDGSYKRAKDKRTFLRIADIDSSENVTPFNKFSEYEKYQYIFCHRGPSEIGAIGVWKWTVEPNKNDPKKPFFDANYIDNPNICQIIVDRNIVDTNQLVLKLKEGIQIDSFHSNISIMYVYGEGDSYVGILVQKDNFESEGKYFKLKAKVCKLQYYRIKIEDTCKCQDSIFNHEYVFLSSTILPRFENFIFVQETEEYIKNLFIDRLCWKNMKNMKNAPDPLHFHKDDYKDFKAFLKGMPTEDFRQKIAKEYQISPKEVEEKINAFISNSESFFKYEDIDSKYIDDLVISHPKLRQKCIELVSAQKESEIEALDKDIEEKEAIKNQLDQKIKELEKNRNELEQSIAKQETEIGLFEENINSKISAAQNNVSDFFAQISLMHPFLSKLISQPQHTGYFVKGKTIDDDKVIPYLNKSDLLRNVRDALSDAGIDDKRLNMVSAFLLSAWENRVPILLVGPNSNEIADAMSIAIQGKFADRIKCIGNYSEITCRESGGIVVINNVFYADWLSHIDEIINNDANYYYVTSNFVEDLLIEPKGIFNYMVPILTDVFISQKAKIPSVGGKRSNDYVDDILEESKERCRVDRVLSKIGTSKLYINNIKQIVEHIVDNPFEKEDLNHYFVYLPYLLLTNHREYLIDNLNDSRDKVSTECYETIRNYLGISE